MRPSVWGPKFWFVLHTSSFRYPKKPSPEQKKYMKQFLYAMANQIVPCPDCRVHMLEYIDDPKNGLEYALEDGQEYVKFIWKFHNDVNQRIGKPYMSFTEFKDLYQSYEYISDFGLEISKYSPYVIGFLLGGITTYLIVKSINNLAD